MPSSLTVKGMSRWARHNREKRFNNRAKWVGPGKDTHTGRGREEKSAPSSRAIMGRKEEGALTCLLAYKGKEDHTGFFLLDHVQEKSTRKKDLVVKGGELGQSTLQGLCPGGGAAFPKGRRKRGEEDLSTSRSQV